MDSDQIILEFKSDRDYKKFSRIAAETEGAIDGLISFCYRNDYPFPQYSSWLLAHIADNYFATLLPFHTLLIDAFIDCTDPSTQRNLGNVLLRFPKIGHREGELLDKLFRFLIDPEAKVAVKVYAMNLIYNFLTDYPALKSELQMIIEDGLTRESAAYQSAGKKILKKISGI